MNDQLQQALASILSSTLDNLSAGKTFLLAQLPDVIRQLLVWHAVKSGIAFIALVTATVLLSLIAKRLWQQGGAARGGRTDMGFPSALGAVIISLIASATLCAALNATTWLQILVAPKLYLIEYAASLVRK